MVQDQEKCEQGSVSSSTCVLQYFGVVSCRTVTLSPTSFYYGLVTVGGVALFYVTFCIWSIGNPISNIVQLQLFFLRNVAGFFKALNKVESFIRN